MSDPVPLDRYFPPALAFSILASARKLAMLDVLERRGSLSLGRVIFEGGIPTGGALKDAAELQGLGLITVERPTGRNLSEFCTITERGRKALALARFWAD